MRDSFDKFKAANATIVVVVKDDSDKLSDYWKENSLPFIGIPDPDGVLGNLYNQESKIGLMPAVFVIAKGGNIKLAHYGTSMKDIPTVEKLLSKL